MGRCTLAIAILASAGCAADDAPHDGDGIRIVDMSGAEFLWKDSEVHRIAGVSPPLPSCAPDQEPQYRLMDTSRFAVVMGGCDDGAWFMWWGHDRIAVCTRDDECPSTDERTFECRAGFCQDADTTRYPVDVLTYPDMFELCFGAAPRVTDVVFSVDDYPAYPGTDPDTVAAIDAACSNPGVLIHPCSGELPRGCAEPW